MGSNHHKEGEDTPPFKVHKVGKDEEEKEGKKKEKKKKKDPSISPEDTLLLFNVPIKLKDIKMKITSFQGYANVSIVWQMFRARTWIKTPAWFSEAT